MKKLSEEHYTIVDNSEIKEGDYFLMHDYLIRQCYYVDGYMIIDTKQGKHHVSVCKKITHSTQPLEWFGGEIIFLSEVKELLGAVDVEKKAFELAILFHNTYEKLAPAFGYETRLDTKVFDKNSANGKLMIAVCKEIYQALEDNKEKKYTEEDMRKAMRFGSMRNKLTISELESSFQQLIQSLQPTEWEVEFINGKLQLVKE